MQIKTELLYEFTTPLITATSGLVLLGDSFYCVSDDELSLIKLPRDLSSSVELIKLFPGDLPDDKKERKKLKPDLEAIVYVPALTSLLCVPSGSKGNRTKGALVNLDRHVSELSFKTVYTELSLHFRELNIEGATVEGNAITLIQRGNGGLHQNALIELDLRSFLRDEVKDLKIKSYDLGALKGTPLSFTDGTSYRGKKFYLAVAENTASTFDDGEFRGAVLGCFGFPQLELEISSKPEGLAIEDGIFYLVTDDDDRTKPSKLYRGFLPSLFVD